MQSTQLKYQFLNNIYDRLKIYFTKVIIDGLLPIRKNAKINYFTDFLCRYTNKVIEELFQYFFLSIE